MPVNKLTRITLPNFDFTLPKLEINFTLPSLPDFHYIGDNIDAITMHPEVFMAYKKLFEPRCLYDNKFPIADDCMYYKGIPIFQDKNCPKNNMYIISDDVTDYPIGRSENGIGPTGPTGGKGCVDDCGPTGSTGPTGYIGWTPKRKKTMPDDAGDGEDND